jgi:hypothetical protein
LGAGAATNATINATNGVFTWSPTQGQIGTNGFSVMVTDNGSPPLSATQSFNITVVQSNSPPVLAAISNRTIAVGMTLTLTNVASDTDGDLLTFSLGTGAAANATINATNGIFNWSPTQAQIGTNAFSVIVTDSGLPPLSATQSFSVVVVQSNSPPVLAAISNRTISVGMTLTITNVASDTDGDRLTFNLGTGAATNATINPTNGILNWSPTQTQIGTNAFSVVVTDNGLPSLSATQSFSVTVLASNNPPVLAPISDRTITAGVTLTVTNVATDPDSPPEVLTFSLGPGAAANSSLNATNGVFTWTPTQGQTGTNAFSVIVTDNGLPSLSATQSFKVTVLASNNPPVLAGISNRTIAVGMTLTITNTATDPDSPPQALTFSLGTGAATNASINATNGVFTWPPTQDQIGTNGFSVIVTDNGSPPLSATQSFNVTVVQSNSPPVLAAISNRTIAVGMSLTITNVASDTDGDQLTFSLGTGAAANATLNATNGIFQWAPNQAQIGTNAFSVMVTDSGLPPLTATQSFSVTVVQSNSPPVLAAISDRTIAVRMTLVITNVASDTDGDQLIFSLGAGAAANATINTTNGLFNWSPTQAQIGSNAFSVIVTDNGLPSLSATQSFSVTVLASNNPPVLAAISDRTIAVGMTLTITNVATDPDSPPQVLTFNLGASAATNAVIDATNGVFTWAPTQDEIGSNAFSVIVTDNGLLPLSATQSFSVTVLASNNPPVLAAIPDRTIAEGMTLTITNIATDPDNPPQVLTFSLGAGTATNAVIDATNGVFAWTPTHDEIGTNTFGVIVADNGLPSLSATQAFSVTVLTSNNPPMLAAISNQTIAAGMMLSITNMATDPDSPPQVLTFSLDPGAPTGASIGAMDGVFTWTPADSQAGTPSITVRVTDNGLPNLSDAKTFTVNVLMRPILEAIVMSGNSATLTWNTISGTTYRVQFKTNLTDTAWGDLAPDVTATGATASASDPSSTNDMRFYRVLVVP